MFFLPVGGLSNAVQEAALRNAPDIVVATPGRLIDHLRNARSVGLENLELLVLDEADRLLELGFTAEVEEIVKLCPKQRQTLLFSGTCNACGTDFSSSTFFILCCVARHFVSNDDGRSGPLGGAFSQQASSSDGGPTVHSRRHSCARICETEVEKGRST